VPPTIERKSILNKYVSAVYIEGGAIKKAVVRVPREVVKMSMHLMTSGQFHETSDVTIEPECPFSCTCPLPKKLNEFGIPEKEKYGCPDLATVLGITKSALIWRFCKGEYPEVPRGFEGATNLFN
jgi:hypothetical protein